MDAGEQITYRAYTMHYGLTVDDSVGCTEHERRGVVLGTTKRTVRVRNIDSGRVEHVLYHRIVKNHR
jgi:hypothetical protein